MLSNASIPKYVRTFIMVALVILGSMLFIRLFAKLSFQYNSFSFTLKTRFTPSGGTIINVPPVGRLFIKTHHTPWQFVFTLDAIDFTKLEKQLDSIPTKEQWLKTLERETFHTVLILFLLVTVLGLLGAVSTLLILRIKPSSRYFWHGLLGSFSFILILIAASVLTYDPNAVEHPQYQGVLASAPWAMNLVSMGLDNIEVIGNNLKKISQDLPMLYKQAGQIKNIGDLQYDLAVLHVSDIHNNPAALEFITELVANFEVELIIDTGDLTDYGTALEADIINRIARIKIPYLFIPGNHDSPLIIERLKRIRSVKVLNHGYLKIKGLTIAGQADPASLVYNSDVASEESMKQTKDAFTQTVTRTAKTPDIVAVHNILLAKDLIGHVPLILHGHDHQYRLTTEANTIINNAGTTGAAGLRGLTEEGVPYGAAILYWKKNQTGDLILKAIDSIKINGVAGQLTIERHTF